MRIERTGRAREEKKALSFFLFLDQIKHRIEAQQERGNDRRRVTERSSRSLTEKSVRKMSRDPESSM